MRKFIIYPLALFIILSCSFSSIQKRNDLSEMNLKGNVKSIREESYEAKDKFGEVLKGENKRDGLFGYDEYTLFNREGYVTESFSYNSHSLFNGSREFKYDNKWNLIERTHYYSDSTIEFKHSVKYDNNDHIVGYTNYNSDGSINYKGINSLDKEGNVIKTLDYDMEGEVIEEVNNKYDLNGNKIETIRIDHERNRTNKYVYLYDEIGNNIEFRLYQGSLNPFLISISYYKYDKRGNQIEEEHFWPDSTFKGKKSYVFDLNKNKIDEIDYYYNDEFKYKMNWTYDENENLIKEEWFSFESNKGGQYTYEYEFDSKQNWIKQIKYFNQIPKFIKEREIEYWN